MPDLISINDNMPARGVAASTRGGAHPQENEFTDALQLGAAYHPCIVKEILPGAPAPSQDLAQDLESPIPDFSQIIQGNSIESLLCRTTERVCAQTGFGTPMRMMEPSLTPPASDIISRGDNPQPAHPSTPLALVREQAADNTDTLVHPDAAPWIQDLLDPLKESPESAKVQLKYSANMAQTRTGETPIAILPIPNAGYNGLSASALPGTPASASDSNTPLLLLDENAKELPALDNASDPKAPTPGIDPTASVTPPPLTPSGALPASPSVSAPQRSSLSVMLLPPSVQQVATHFTQTGASVERLEIQLAPATLGVVRVQMEMNDGEMRIHVHATHPHTLELLSTHAKDLAQALSQGGIEADTQHMQFSLQQGDQQQTQQQSSGQRRRVLERASTPTPRAESIDPTKLIDQKV